MNVSEQNRPAVYQMMCIFLMFLCLQNSTQVSFKVFACISYTNVKIIKNLCALIHGLTFLSIQLLCDAHQWSSLRNVKRKASFLSAGFHIGQTSLRIFLHCL